MYSLIKPALSMDVIVVTYSFCYTDVQGEKLNRPSFLSFKTSGIL